LKKKYQQIVISYVSVENIFPKAVLSHRKIFLKNVWQECFGGNIKKNSNFTANNYMNIWQKKK